MSMMLTSGGSGMPTGGVTSSSGAPTGGQIMSSSYQTSTGASPRIAHPGEREVERRQTSSCVISEQYLGALPDPRGEVRYVEVPVVEEVVRRVPKKEVVEIEKIVPRYETEYVERIVEIPQIQYVDRPVEVEQIQEIVRHVAKKQIIDVPREVVKTVPRVEFVPVEKVIEVPGEIIEVPKPYSVENKINVPHYVDNEVPMVVAQTIKPMITESTQTVDVDVFEYEPQVVVVDVHVPKPVPSKLIAGGKVAETHQVVTVPAAQYNSMLKMLNSHIQDVDQREVLPYVLESSGAMPMLHGFEAQMMYPAPVPLQKIEGYIANAHVSRHVQLGPGMTITTVTNVSTTARAQVNSGSTTTTAITSNTISHYPGASSAAITSSQPGTMSGMNRMPQQIQSTAGIWVKRDF